MDRGCSHVTRPIYNHRMADAEAVLSITVRCAQCGVDSDKKVVRHHEGGPMLCQPIFMEMEGKLLEDDVERACRSSETPAGRPKAPDTIRNADRTGVAAPWYLCVRCWFDGIRGGVAPAATRVMEG